jgi:hypothetical protein
MVIGSESVNHGVQFFDMKKLLTLDPAKPKNFSTSTDLAGWFNDLPAGRSHNVVVVSQCCGLLSPIDNDRKETPVISP